MKRLSYAAIITTFTLSLLLPQNAVASVDGWVFDAQIVSEAQRVRDVTDFLIRHFKQNNPKATAIGVNFVRPTFVEIYVCPAEAEKVCGPLSDWKAVGNYHTGANIDLDDLFANDGGRANFFLMLMDHMWRNLQAKHGGANYLKLVGGAH